MRTAVLVVMLVVAGLAGAGCSRISDKASDGDAGSAPSQAPARPILVTKAWGVVDGMLSVAVENTTDRTLRSAVGVITARDRNDVLIATSLESPDGCCAVVDLPPGQQFGFYVDIGNTAADISRVDVAYRNVAWAPAAEEPANPLTAHPVRIDGRIDGKADGSADGAVVVASIRNTEPRVDQASVQAFLDGPDGKFLAVVAGRWYCFAQGRNEIRMQLLHPVPAGTTVDHVVIHPVTDDTDGTALNCAGPVQAG
jgi:hypothetical protein